MMRESEELALSVLEDEGKVIAYRPAIAHTIGSVTATILLQQIIYRFKHKREAFYKFRDGCAHELYSEGDSWCEELGFTIKQFDNARDIIATKVEKGVSKNDLMAHSFEGDTFPASSLKYLVAYWTDSNRVTWYWLNRHLLGKLLKGIYLDNSQKGIYLENRQRAFTSLTENTPQKTTKKTISPSHDDETRALQADKDSAANVDVDAPAPKKSTRAKNAQVAPAAAVEPRPRNELYDAVKEVWGWEGGINARFCKWLSGASVMDELRFDTPVTPAEVIAFARWWRAKTPNPSINFVAKAGLVYREIGLFRAEAVTVDDSAQRLAAQINAHVEEQQQALERIRAEHAEKLRSKRAETARRLALQNENGGSNEFHD